MGQVPEIDWRKSFGATGDEIARTAIQTSDGDFLVAGFTDSDCGAVVGNNGGNDAWVVRLNPNGGIVWAKCIGTPGNEEVFSMQHTTAGNIILAGIKSVNGGDAWVFEMDENGEVLWEATYGGPGLDVAHSIAPTSDGGYIVAGMRNEVESNGVWLGDGWVFKIDEVGQLLWEQTLTGTKQNSISTIRTTEDGGYVAAGVRDLKKTYKPPSPGLPGMFVFTEGDFWVLKMDENGNKLWEQIYGGPGHDHANDILQTTNGDFVAAGKVESGKDRPFVAKIDKEGMPVWQTFLGFDTLEGPVYSIYADIDGGYTLACYGTTPGEEVVTGDFGTRLIKIGPAGNYIYGKYYSEIPTNVGTVIIPTIDTGYFVAGYRYFTPSYFGCPDVNHGFFVMKLRNSNPFYVDQDATGANNGTSWMDAFTDLQSALAVVQPNDHIWVAEGRYFPGNTDSATFLIDKDIKIYGGFAGTETELSQRDWAAYPTILSGDVNGDDIANNFTDNRSDNVNNILHLTADVTNEMVLDGFIVQGGHADDNSSSVPEALRGGGLWSAGSPTLRNCTFRQNYAEELGAGAFFGDLTSDVVMQDCIFEANKVKESPAGGFGGAMFVLNSTAFQKIERCVFQNNFTGSLALVAANAEISECQFINNKNYSDGAGLLAVMQTDSAFVQVKDCQFTGNVSGQLGAGILAVCLEENNHLMVTDCTFEGNVANGLSAGGGMAAIASGDNGNIAILRSEFKGNIADEGGGLLVQATFLGQPAPGATNLNVNIVECVFEENHALDLNPNILTGGGGICLLNISGSDKTHVNIDECRFISNTSEEYGGGLTIYEEPGNATYTVSNCQFSENSATQNAGGISYISYGAKASTMNILSSIFEQNEGELAGAMRIRNFRPWNSTVKDRVNIENCLVARNYGATGGISVQASSDVFMTESTIADNAFHGLTLNSAGNAHLRNTIFHNNLGGNYFAPDTQTGITSLGGNMSDDASFVNVFGPMDQSETDPLFTGSGGHPYQLSAGSPAIDAAVPAGNVPPLDLAGNPRVQGAGLDIGAYESPFTTAGQDQTANSVALKISPNPAPEYCWIQLENQWQGTVTFTITDEMGRAVIHKSSEKSNNHIGFYMDLSALPAGKYVVTASFGNEKETGILLRP